MTYLQYWYMYLFEIDHHTLDLHVFFHLHNVDIVLQDAPSSLTEQTEQIHSVLRPTPPIQTTDGCTTLKE